MWLTNIFRPTQADRFYELLDRHAALLCEASATLLQYIETDDAALSDRVHEIENRGDETLRDMIEALQDTFVTPIDRQDLYGLSAAMDRMLDYLNNAARELKLFAIGATPEMAAMGKILTDATHHILDAVQALHTEPKRATDAARAAINAEHRMEDLYRKTIAVLFDDPDLPRALKRREIYRHLSNSADRAESIGRLIRKIVVKEV
jgi:predicted phosphate transport protein (TIGR00153 family)